MPNNFGGSSSRDAVRRDVSGDYRVRANNAVLSDSHVRQHHHVRAQEDPFADVNERTSSVDLRGSVSAPGIADGVGRIYNRASRREADVILDNDAVARHDVNILFHIHVVADNDSTGFHSRPIDDLESCAVSNETVVTDVDLPTSDEGDWLAHPSAFAERTETARVVHKRHEFPEVRTKSVHREPVCLRISDGVSVA